MDDQMRLILQINKNNHPDPLLEYLESLIDQSVENLEREADRWMKGEVQKGQ
jgi:hypothetical protein